MPGGQPLRRAARALPLALLTALGGCARPVAVEPPDVDPATAQVCGAFTSALPEELTTVGGRRGVEPDSGLTAAYGDPPVAIRCGVPEPAALGPLSELVTVDGVDWLPEELTHGWVLTTVGRQANVEVTVPDEHGLATSVAADLAPTVSGTIPPIED